jgi:hypothetical protein
MSMTMGPELTLARDEQLGKDNDELVFFLFTIRVLDLSLRFLELAPVLRLLVASVIGASSCFGSGTFVAGILALGFFPS